MAKKTKRYNPQNYGAPEKPRQTHEYYYAFVRKEGYPEPPEGKLIDVMWRASGDVYLRIEDKGWFYLSGYRGREDEKARSKWVHAPNGPTF